jgi:hypothetical protein
MLIKDIQPGMDLNGYFARFVKGYTDSEMPSYPTTIILTESTNGLEFGINWETPIPPDPDDPDDPGTPSHLRIVWGTKNSSGVLEEHYLTLDASGIIDSDIPKTGGLTPNIVSVMQDPTNPSGTIPVGINGEWSIDQESLDFLEIIGDKIELVSDMTDCLPSDLENRENYNALIAFDSIADNKSLLGPSSKIVFEDFVDPELQLGKHDWAAEPFVVQYIRNKADIFMLLYKWTDFGFTLTFKTKGNPDLDVYSGGTWHVKMIDMANYGFNSGVFSDEVIEYSSNRDASIEFGSGAIIPAYLCTSSPTINPFRDAEGSSKALDLVNEIASRMKMAKAETLSQYIGGRVNFLTDTDQAMCMLINIMQQCARHIMILYRWPFSIRLLTFRPSRDAQQGWDATLKAWRLDTLVPGFIGFKGDEIYSLNTRRRYPKLTMDQYEAIERFYNDQNSPWFHKNGYILLDGNYLRFPVLPDMSNELRFAYYTKYPFLQDGGAGVPFSSVNYIVDDDTSTLIDPEVLLLMTTAHFKLMIGGSGEAEMALFKERMQKLVSAGGISAIKTYADLRDSCNFRY